MASKNWKVAFLILLTVFIYLAVIAQIASAVTVTSEHYYGPAATLDGRQGINWMKIMFNRTVLNETPVSLRIPNMGILYTGGNYDSLPDLVGCATYAEVGTSAHAFDISWSTEKSSYKGTYGAWQLAYSDLVVSISNINTNNFYSSSMDDVFDMEHLITDASWTPGAYSIFFQTGAIPDDGKNRTAVNNEIGAGLYVDHTTYNQWGTSSDRTLSYTYNLITPPEDHVEITHVTVGPYYQNGTHEFQVTYDNEAALENLSIYAINDALMTFWSNSYTSGFPDTFVITDEYSGQVGIYWQYQHDGQAMREGLLEYYVTPTVIPTPTPWEYNLTPTPTPTIIPLFPTFPNVEPIQINLTDVNLTFLQPYYDISDNIAGAVNSTIAIVMTYVHWPFVQINGTAYEAIEIVYQADTLMSRILWPIKLLMQGIFFAFPAGIILFFSYSIALDILRQILGSR